MALLTDWVNVSILVLLSDNLNVWLNNGNVVMIQTAT